MIGSRLVPPHKSWLKEAIANTLQTTKTISPARSGREAIGFPALCQPYLTKKRHPSFDTLQTIKVIATTNTTWAQTIAMTARIVGAFGTEGQAFPTPAQIAAVPFPDFAEKARMGYRSTYVYAIASAIATGELDLEAWQSEALPASDLRKRLLGLPGVGPYGAACLLLYLGKPEHVNSDSVARAALTQELGRPVSDKEVHAFFEAHGEWRGLVYNFYPWKQE